jgi:hypothetical protein
VLDFITQGLFIFFNDCFEVYDAIVFLLHDQTCFSFNSFGFCFKFLDELLLFYALSTKLLILQISLRSLHFCCNREA